MQVQLQLNGQQFLLLLRLGFIELLLLVLLLLVVVLWEFFVVHMELRGPGRRDVDAGEAVASSHRHSCTVGDLQADSRHP